MDGKKWFKSKRNWKWPGGEKDSRLLFGSKVIGPLTVLGLNRYNTEWYRTQPMGSTLEVFPPPLPFDPLILHSNNPASGKSRLVGSSIFNIRLFSLRFFPSFTTGFLVCKLVFAAPSQPTTRESSRLQFTISRSLFWLALVWKPGPARLEPTYIPHSLSQSDFSVRPCVIATTTIFATWLFILGKHVSKL